MGHWLEDSVTASRSASPGSGDKNDLLLEDGSVYSVQGTSSISWTGSGMLLGLIGWHSGSDPPHRVPPITSKLSCTLAMWLSMMTLSLGLQSCPWGFCQALSFAHRFHLSCLSICSTLHLTLIFPIPWNDAFCVYISLSVCLVSVNLWSYVHTSIYVICLLPTLSSLRFHQSLVTLVLWVFSCS